MADSPPEFAYWDEAFDYVRGKGQPCRVYLVVGSPKDPAGVRLRQEGHWKLYPSGAATWLGIGAIRG